VVVGRRDHAEAADELCVLHAVNHRASAVPERECDRGFAEEDVTHIFTSWNRIGNGSDTLTGLRQRPEPSAAARAGAVGKRCGVTEDLIRSVSRASTSWSLAAVSLRHLGLWIVSWRRRFTGINPYGSKPMGGVKDRAAPSPDGNGRCAQSTSGEARGAG
jgi:hypothetical protein